MKPGGIRRQVCASFAIALVGLSCNALSRLAPAPPPGPIDPAALPTSPPATVAALPIRPPSAGWIAFVNQNNLWLVHPDGTSLQQITSNPYPPANSWASNLDLHPAWAPDGASLAFTQGPRLFHVEIATLKVTLLADNTNGGFGWSADSGTLMYGTRPLTSDPLADEGLWSVDLVDGSTRRITPNQDGFWQPEWSPDGSHVLYAKPGIDPNGYAIMSLSTQRPVDLPLNVMGGIGVGACQWSPDLTVACITLGEEFPFNPVLRLIDTDGRLLQEVALPEDVSIDESDLRWSPDGQRLAIPHIVREFDVLPAEARIDVFTRSSGTLTEVSLGYASDWSSDGNWIASYDLAWDTDQLPRPMALVNASTGETYPFLEGFTPVWQPPSMAAPPVPTISPEGPAGTPGAADSLCTSATITRIDTPKGDYLQMCANGEQVEVGPLEGGGYQMGPNGQFFVYCSNSGGCYAARVGETRLTLIGTIRDFAIIRRGQDPIFRFEWHGDNPYRVTVYEDVMQENATFIIPSRISAED